jgi:two-component system chemotaxis sensor kinase CheA
MDRDKYRQLFIDEARENLRTFARELLEFDKKQKEEGAPPAGAMDSVFRAAHSLKGMAASLGYDGFADLAHNLEDLADLGRQGARLDREAIDLLLEGGDELEALVDEIEVGGEGHDVTALIARVAAALAKAKPEAEAEAEAEAPAAPVAARPAPTPSGAQLVVVKLDPNASLPQARAFMVHRTLSGMAGYVSTHPGVDEIRRGEIPDGVVRFAFGADADVEAAAESARGSQGVASVEIEAAAPAPAPKEEPRAPKEEERTLRVKAALLDDFIDSVGELLLARSRLRVLAEQLDSPELSNVVDEVERVTRDLHEGVVSARMTPLAFVTDRLPRVVRDLARQTGRTVSLDVSGAEIELDRAILDELFTPLLHMIRNAVDHGHAGDEARVAAGKPAGMTLSLRASRDRDLVVIELADDGRGIDAEKVRARAVERGVITAAEAATLGDDRSLELICEPGFSTAEAVTERSGRGVGMDVVRSTLEHLGGNLQIASRPGEGTRFRLRLPLTVAIIHVLVIEAGPTSNRSVMAIPVARVERALDLAPELVTQARGRDHLALGDELIPLDDLGERLGLGDSPGDTAILIGWGGAMQAFRVGSVLGQEEVVAKPLGKPLSQLAYLSGATLLADGRAAYILEPQRL